MPPMLPYEPVAELARLYDIMRDEGMTRRETIIPLARKLGIPQLTAGRAITAAVALGLVPRWSLKAHCHRSLPAMVFAYSEYLAERTASRTEDVAELWPQYYRPGNYEQALARIAGRMRLSTRTVERHMHRARETGLL